MTPQELFELGKSACEWAIENNVPIRRTESYLNAEIGCCVLGLIGLKDPSRFGVSYVDSSEYAIGLNGKRISGFDVSDILGLSKEENWNFVFGFDSYGFSNDRRNNPFFKQGKKLAKLFILS